MSGADCKDGTIIRKGAYEAIKTFVQEREERFLLTWKAL